MTPLRRHFLLDDSVAYLNHGGFGATPVPVMEARLEMLRRFEANPTRRYMRELETELAAALSALAPALSCSDEQIAFTPNATTGLNLVARSLAGCLEPGDEVLLTDVEYGSQETLWKWVCEEAGATCRAVPVAGCSVADFAATFEAHLTPATKVVMMSHVSSATALRLPIETLTGSLRQRGVVSVVDGAHAPGQIPLDVPAVGADYYVGNLHKWFAAARPAGFVYAEPGSQARLDPLVVNWGGTDRQVPLSTRTNRPGTADASQWLTIPDALAFHAEHLAPARQGARDLLEEVAGSLAELGFERVGRPGDDLMMSAFWLPRGTDPDDLRERIGAAAIEAIVGAHGGRPLLRICVAWYTAPAEIDRLLEVCRAGGRPSRPGRL